MLLNCKTHKPWKTRATVRERVIQAYECGKCSAKLVSIWLYHPNNSNNWPAPLDGQAALIFEKAQQRLNLSARGYHRILRVARTIADLAQSEHIQTGHLTEALSYRQQNA